MRQILQTAGFEVSDPAEIELGPSNAFTAMAEGSCDFWANSWYPGHFSWFENQLSDGSLVADHVEAVPGLFQDSGVQGFLVTKSSGWTEEPNASKNPGKDWAYTSLPTFIPALLISGSQSKLPRSLPPQKVRCNLAKASRAKEASSTEQPFNWSPSRMSERSSRISK